MCQKTSKIPKIQCTVTRYALIVEETFFFLLSEHRESFSISNSQVTETVLKVIFRNLLRNNYFDMNGIFIR